MSERHKLVIFLSHKHPFEIKAIWGFRCKKMKICLEKVIGLEMCVFCKEEASFVVQFFFLLKHQ